jgi:Caspase domain
VTGRLALAALLLILGADAAAGQDFGSSYALVIGVDDYGSLGLSRLSNAETDARAVERYFRAQRYQVTALIGAGTATKRGVQGAVRDIAARITDRDRFVFFFAGHGKAQRQEGVDVAYLVVPGGRVATTPRRSSPPATSSSIRAA